jgi:hypothetical protein
MLNVLQSTGEPSPTKEPFSPAYQLWLAEEPCSREAQGPPWDITFHRHWLGFNYALVEYYFSTHKFNLSIKCFQCKQPHFVLLLHKMINGPSLI